MSAKSVATPGIEAQGVNHAGDNNGRSSSDCSEAQVPTPPHTPVETGNHVLCRECDESLAVWYCEICKAICQECWDGRKPHRRNDPEHVRTSYEEYVLFGDVLQSNLSEDDRRKLHEIDQATLWFAVDGPKEGPLSLEELPRFSQAIGEHREQYGMTLVFYPRLVSFVGDTGAGKSSLVRLLIEHSWDMDARRKAGLSGSSFPVPVVGRPQTTLPTSGDVHLYRDPILEASEISSPVFYADGEGTGGGQQETQAHRHQRGAYAVYSRLTGDFGEIRRWAEASFGFLSRGFRRTISTTYEREEAVKEIFPRLLYNFSDVIVHVMLSAAARQMENHIAKLLQWAHASHASAINRLTLPHLIVILNQSDDDSAWDPAETTRQVLAEQAGILDGNRVVASIRDAYRKSGARIDCLEDLLKQSYSSIHFIRLPRVASCARLSEQLRLLHATIRDCSQEGQRQKMQANMLLSSKALDQFFKLAFDHYANKLNEPFDLLKVLLTVQPPPDTLSANISWMLQQTFKVAQKDIGPDDDSKPAAAFAQAVAPVICSVIALDIVRSYEHLPGTFVDIFRGGVPRTNCNAWKLSGLSYEKQVSTAFADFIEKSMVCEFADGDVQCVNRYKAHLLLGRHQGSQGFGIGYGPFQSEVQDEVSKHFETELGESLASLTQVLEQGSLSLVATSATAIRSMPATKQPRVNPREAVIWATHMSHLDRLYERFPSLVIGDVLTCFWCMRNEVAEILPCSHAVCETCLAALGVIDETLDSRLVQLDACNLHNPPKKFPDPVKFLLLPSTIGRRVLSIDGGGVRGIVSLSILSAIEQKLGGEIPISELFDLVGGTSVGGLAALGLVLKNWKAKHTVDMLTKLSREAFTPHSQWNLVQLFKHAKTGATYRTETLENAIQAAFGKPGQVPLLSSMGEKSDGQRKRVFVTTTTEGGELGTILTNYTRPSGNGSKTETTQASKPHECSYDFEANYRVGREMKVWQAARATSAAPLYFEPMITADGYEYWDGGLFFNNPALAASQEAELLWPATAKRPDILLSVGNGTSSHTQTSHDLKGSPGISRSGRRVRHGEGLWGILRHLRMLRGRLLKNMDSESMWNEKFAFLARNRPARYVRLNPAIREKLPALDDIQAVEDGKLMRIATDYLRQRGTQAQINRVVFTLISTSFYFQPIRRSYESDSGHINVEGRIMCRFVNGSETMRQFGRAIGKLSRARFVLMESRKVWELDKRLLTLLTNPGVCNIPIEVITPSYHTEVDIRFLCDGFEGGSISGFPMVLGDSH
ncbi:hypothetical protein QBC47DRAFT_389002 [Echria macrotheca]|uniref:PNPLA domain-containing protein n=1 Tax=Echria macrotheca TaxID=438768 RepID=A0AAJ0B7H2_9PEZI|nr:hypothetical protein QBC47DRAFT_389002 [Echria macrotheca]